MEYKPLPIGIDNFEKIITQGYYYVDKTLLIKELLDKGGEVTLFTRPRRFGKSLNISMLQHFFAKMECLSSMENEPSTEQDRSCLFSGLKIMDAGEKYTSQMGKYPVIKMTLKLVEGETFESAFAVLKEELRREFAKHRYLLESAKLDEETKDIYKTVLTKTAPKETYEDSLRFLSDCLTRHYKSKTIILIDEYDVPLEKAHFNGYYEKMIMTLRSMYNGAFKSNDSLHFAVLTGCLRISKESIFTGLNNFNVISILSEEFDEYFGFTEKEVKDTLSYYQLDSKMDTLKEWYDGYIFGQANVYNPWSVVLHLRKLQSNADAPPLSYWSNTSSNSIVRDLIEISDTEARDEIELLIQGGSITKPVHEDITYAEIRQNMDNLWNFLFFTGYLKKTGEEFLEEERYCTLTIPNKEVLYIYKHKIKTWFDEKIKFSDPAILLNAILGKDVASLESELNKRLLDIISFHDSGESFYHGFLLGILSNVKGYSVKSNREAGTGRTDIFLKDRGIKKQGVIFELKIVKDKDDPEAKCQEALAQIAEKQYARALEEEGYRNILKYGIAFRGKQCLVVVE